MNGTMTVIVSKDKEKIKLQIKALKSVLAKDTNEKDKQYHQLAINTLKKALEE